MAAVKPPKPTNPLGRLVRRVRVTLAELRRDARFMRRFNGPSGLDWHRSPGDDE